MAAMGMETEMEPETETEVEVETETVVPGLGAAAGMVTVMEGPAMDLGVHQMEAMEARITEEELLDHHQVAVVV